MIDEKRKTRGDNAGAKKRQALSIKTEIINSMEEKNREYSSCLQ